MTSESDHDTTPAAVAADPIAGVRDKRAAATAKRIVDRFLKAKQATPSGAVEQALWGEIAAALLGERVAERAACRAALAALQPPKQEPHR